MHKTKLGHHDLKAANIFMDYDVKFQGMIREPKDIIKYNFRVVLGDLGLASKYTNDESYVFNAKGTPYYYAPEIWNIRLVGKYNHQADIWAIGCLAIYLYFKRFMIPFDS